MEDLLGKLLSAGYELHAFSNYPQWFVIRGSNPFLSISPRINHPDRKTPHPSLSTATLNNRVEVVHSHHGYG
eukprot:881672-Pyramimonas_sp.AAC.2